jgi:pimeloyl-ACP methyl ester carboxylesterase
MAHANSFLARLWEPVALRLAARYRVIAYDLRGQGDSDKPPGGYHWRALVEDLRGLLDAFGLRGIPLVGHSSGGAAAACLAAERPEYASALCLIEPIIPPPEFAASPAPSQAMAAAARKRRQVWDSPHALVEAYRRRPTFARWREDVLRLYAEHGLFRREDGHYQLKCSGEVEAQVFENSTSLDIWSLVPAIRCPTLIMRGETTDPFMSSMFQRVAERIPGARLVTIPGAGHLAPMEEPEAVAEEVWRFLGDVQGHGPAEEAGARG